MSKDEQTAMIDIQHVVKLSTVEYGACEECKRSQSSMSYSVTDDANHYITEHGYRILHVGQETSESAEGGLWHATVIVLGK